MITIYGIFSRLFLDFDVAFSKVRGPELLHDCIIESVTRVFLQFVILPQAVFFFKKIPLKKCMIKIRWELSHCIRTVTSSYINIITNFNLPYEMNI